MDQRSRAASDRTRHGRRGVGVALQIVLLAALAAVLPAAAWAEPKFPDLTGRIVDNAGLLKPEDRAAIEQELAAIEAKSTDQVVVVTLPLAKGHVVGCLLQKRDVHTRADDADRDLHHARRRRRRRELIVGGGARARDDSRRGAGRTCRRRAFR